MRACQRAGRRPRVENSKWPPGHEHNAPTNNQELELAVLQFQGLNPSNRIILEADSSSEPQREYSWPAS